MIGYVNKLNDYLTGKTKKVAQSIPASLFFRKDDAMGIEGLPFDLFIAEKHKLSFRIGDHPLQNGVTISDHVRRELREVSIDGMFTNHPIKKTSKSEVVRFKDDYASKRIESELIPVALNKFNRLKILANKKEPVRLVCSLDTYPKMIITEISYDRDSKSGSSIRFSMTLREVVTVDLKTSTQNIDFDPKKLVTEQEKQLKGLCTNGKTSTLEKEASVMKDLAQVDAS